MQPIGSYGWAYGPPLPKVHDEIVKTYKDLRNKIEVKWAVSLLMVKFPTAYTANGEVGFTS